jgi:crotonobetainyl-CoA:carnitine CoA-transferase CaiB-like acyl-CoA transferase
MLMADMGAEIVKIEPPPLGDDSRQWGPPFIGGISTYISLSVNRNKKSLGLNLKTAEGQAILWKLIERADVLIENFRPGVLDKLGFGYEAVRKVNARTVTVRYPDSDIRDPIAIGRDTMSSRRASRE